MCKHSLKVQGHTYADDTISANIHQKRIRGCQALTVNLSFLPICCEMEVLPMVVVLHALFLHQGLQSAAISSNKNETNTTISNGLVEKRSPGGSLHTASVSVDCSETLLAFQHSRWVTLTLTRQSNEAKKDMAQLCEDLGCGGVFAENGTASVNTCLSDCTIENSNLYNCTEDAADNCSNMVEVACAWQAVQLIGGSDRCAGRVELFGPGGWGSVCDDGWDLKGGNVVCAQLGCGTALRVMGEAGDFVAGSGPIHIIHINCSGTERNLWQCGTEMNRGRNYCGHKEDASVVCSGSSHIQVTTVNTFMTNVTNWTTETVIVVDADNKSGGISPPVLGCIVLSVTLLLLLLSNAAQCAYYKRRNGGPEVRGASQASQRDNSDTSSDSDYEHYYNPHLPPPRPENNYEHDFDDCVRVVDCNKEQRGFCEGRNAVQTHTLDSESTSSGECYEKTEIQPEELMNPAKVNQLYPEYCIQMSPMHNTSEAAKNDEDSFDSDSTSSGECYENTEVNAKPCVQPLEGDPLLPEQPLLSHPIPQPTENCSVFQPCSPDQADALDSESTSSGECYENIEPEMENLLNPAVNQFSPENCIQRTPVHNTTESANNDEDSFESDSTASGECYENTGVNAEPFFQTLEGDPLLPEHPPMSHPIPQLAGNSSVSQPYSLDQDDSSTSSEEPYENVAEIDKSYFARSEPSVHSSSDSDYDDVSNW
ncbi:T-cell differentiation antigen CD6-like isoform X2 [Hemibagrus wyckioides]|uniref:T-cell differentiation antigen CD6-like isoform X2 n=1 Tax=Hemibagrus wyckioides TaxID=337641 RepID=UPI00266BE43A|nr:T-cell differentiation antigen CD6-like isoform X2 [Hemibagrus wyckioides]